jgi:hypothetical protein
MAAHGICFDFYYRPKPSQIGQNGSAAARCVQADIDIMVKNWFGYRFSSFETPKFLTSANFRHLSEVMLS